MKECMEESYLTRKSDFQFEEIPNALWYFKTKNRLPVSNIVEVDQFLSFLKNDKLGKDKMDLIYSKQKQSAIVLEKTTRSEDKTGHEWNLMHLRFIEEK